MRYVRAATLLAGACLLALAVNDLSSRRAADAESRRHSLEQAAELAAARLDGRIAASAAALATADPASPRRLSSLLGANVCAPSDPSACGLDAEAVELAAESAALSGWVAVVVDESHVLVAAERDDRDDTALVAVLPASAAGSTASVARAGSSRGAAAVAPLETDFSSGRWVLRLDDAGSSARGAFGAAGVAAIVAALAVGAAAVVWALASIVGDLRGLRRQATTDSLTGLPNRAEFERRAGALLSRLVRDGSGACVMLVDLDSFKQINDVGGHAAGDRVLIEAAGRLRRGVRETDLVARWGGDEFVVLLAGVDDPLAVPDRTAAIEANLRGIPTVDGAELAASVGAAVAPLDGRDLDTLLEVADRAMYRNKPSGSRIAARRLS